MKCSSAKLYVALALLVAVVVTAACYAGGTRGGGLVEYAIEGTGNQPKPTGPPTESYPVPTYPPLSRLPANKRGVGARLVTREPYPLRLLNKVSWWYNWGTHPNLIPAGQFGQEFVPMLWGKWGADGLDAAMAKLKQEGHAPKAIMGYNEPNVPGQANLSPSVAADAWPALEAVAKKHGLRLGSPCPAPGNWPIDPYKWMDQWIAAYKAKNRRDPHFDFTCTHFYGCKLEWLKGHLAKLKKYGKPIWLTEFACPAGPVAKSPATAAGQAAFLKEAMAYLDSDSSVERYAYFTLTTKGNRWLGDSAGLYDPDTRALTPAGQVYNQ